MPRVKQPRLWRTDRVDLTGPIYVQSLAQEPMGHVLTAVGQLPCPEFFHDRLITIASIQLRFAVAEVIRLRWYPKMRIEIDGKSPRSNTQALIRAEGLILSKLLNIVNEVFLLYPSGYEHPAYWWFECCLEPSCHRPLRGEGKTIADRMFEADTAALKDRKNPFHSESSKRLFDGALHLSDDSTNCASHRDSDLFYPSKYLPYLEARSKLSLFLRKKGTIALKR